jgi:hypothetical protein
MIYRDQGYVSEAARELIAIVRDFNWTRRHPQEAVTQASSRASR